MKGKFVQSVKTFLDVVRKDFKGKTYFKIKLERWIVFWYQRSRWNNLNKIMHAYNSMSFPKKLQVSQHYQSTNSEWRVWGELGREGVRERGELIHRIIDLILSSVMIFEKFWALVFYSQYYSSNIYRYPNALSRDMVGLHFPILSDWWSQTTNFGQWIVMFVIFGLEP